MAPGVLVLKPDLPENMDDWPFLWGEHEDTVGSSAHHSFLAHQANDLLKK